MKRTAVVDFAASWLGKPAPEAMWRRMLGYVPRQRVHWCAIFYAWCVVETLGVPWRWRVGVGADQFLGRGLVRTRTPLPGDCAVYRRAWHHAMVDYDPDPYDGTVPTIDGNAGCAPGVVATATRSIDAALYYLSIEPLLATEDP